MTINSKFTIGSKVSFKPDHHTHPIVIGTIYQFVDGNPNKVLVKFKYNQIIEYSIDQLVSDEESYLLKNKLEDEFKLACSNVRPLALEALALLAKANELAKVNGVKIREIGYDISSDIIHQVSKAGWNT